MVSEDIKALIDLYIAAEMLLNYGKVVEAGLLYHYIVDHADEMIEGN